MDTVIHRHRQVLVRASEGNCGVAPKIKSKSLATTLSMFSNPTGKLGCAYA